MNLNHRLIEIKFEKEKDDANRLIEIKFEKEKDDAKRLIDIKLKKEKDDAKKFNFDVQKFLDWEIFCHLTYLDMGDGALDVWHQKRLSYVSYLKHLARKEEEEKGETT